MSMNSGQEKRVPPEYDLISTTTPDSRITYTNEHFTNIVGYSSEELEGQYHNIVRHPDMPKAAFKDMWDHLKDKKSWMGTVKNRCKDGGYYWVNAYVTPILKENGDILEYKSVRAAPVREDVERAEKYYNLINNGKLPRVLRYPALNIPLVNKLLTVVTLSSLVSSVIWQLPVIIPGIGITAGIVQLMFSQWWGNKLTAVSKVATKNFKTDITKVLYTGRRDEIAGIEFSLKIKAAELRAVVGRTGDTCSKIMLEAEDDAANIKTISEVVDNQRRETEQLATAINQMSASIKEVANNANSASDLTNEAKTTADLGQEKIANSIQAVNTLNKELARSKETISDLVTSADQIGNIISVIRNIADQTNLLALNAAIEAARAGEHGRGFAVVADEVRALASKTRHSTDEISSMIETLQQSTNATVETIEHGVNLSEACSQYASEAGDVFNQISNMLNHVTDASHQIAVSVVEQSTVTEEINKSIMKLHDLADESTSGSHDALERISLLVEHLTGLYRLINQFKK